MVISWALWKGCGFWLHIWTPLLNRQLDTCNLNKGYRNRPISVAYNHHFSDQLFEHGYTVIPGTATATSQSTTHKAYLTWPLRYRLFNGLCVFYMKPHWCSNSNQDLQQKTQNHHLTYYRSSATGKVTSSKEVGITEPCNSLGAPGGFLLLFWFFVTLYLV